MKAGIAAPLLVSQVKNTAAWLWSAPNVPAVAIFEGAASSSKAAPFDLLLAAHYATVATFVPTDVDARIRHHVWAAITDREAMNGACAQVDATSSWDPRIVSARVHESPHGTLSGHDGEWLAVRAGALGRAIALGWDDIADAVMGAIDRELEREATIAREAATVEDKLRVATIVAHNLGDLSRVVADWPTKSSEVQGRYVRLGHPDAATKHPTFIECGTLNKAIMAHENHRFLPLRKPRALRTSRSLLLPIGPWFDPWGETIARSEHLEDRDRAEVLAALLEIHARDPNQEGCLRAIAGMHRATRGGIERYVADLPARMRKDALRGRVRDALDIDVARFSMRIQRRFEAATAAARGGQ